MTIKTRSPGIYQTLVAQLDKVARHNRQGSFRTKERYYEAMQRFCRFLSEEYRLQKLANINGKHLTAYVLYLQEQEKSASTIKTDLAAIRFFHDKMERTKYRLPSNDELAVELERRRFGGVDRTWSVREFHRFLVTCMVDGHEDYTAIACLTWYAGLRIHECFRIDTAIARLQQYICKVSPQIQDEDSTRLMTHHGLRHSYAARTYQEFIDGGTSPLSASLRVSQLLGHERPDVTQGYLASISKDGADGK